MVNYQNRVTQFNNKFNKQRKLDAKKIISEQVMQRINIHNYIHI